MKHSKVDWSSIFGFLFWGGLIGVWILVSIAGSDGASSQSNSISETPSTSVVAPAEEDTDSDISTYEQESDDDYSDPDYESNYSDLEDDVNGYTNTYGNWVPSPSYENYGSPTALCEDGTYSYSESRRGTCSSHGGVASWY